jgi:tetratricopeptide (TPR) repeat protein
MGRVIQAYRQHPWHGRPLAQEIVAGWMCLTQTQLSRIETGPPLTDLTKLIQWARVLRVPPNLLWFKLPGERSGGAKERTGQPVATTNRDTSAFVAAPTMPAQDEVDDMNRRDLLRLLSMAGALVAAPSLGELDTERLATAAEHPGRVDATTLTDYETLNAHLWRVFAASTAKRRALPVVQQQLDVLTRSLQAPHDGHVHRRLCALAGDLFQLTGEIFFDGNRYTDAAHCYSLAASASKEAEAYDLWACAMTRHAFIGVYERQFDRALPLLDTAAELARRGDQSLSTRHWVANVQAQATAGLGDLAGCQRALATAEQVTALEGPVHTGGWLRFEGARLAEERGSCYTELQRPDLAEPALLEALDRPISARRRGSVLTDLAAIAAQRRDLSRLVLYGEAAVEAAQQTSSGVVGHKLHGLQPRLVPFLTDRQVNRLHEQIANLRAPAPT